MGSRNQRVVSPAEPDLRAGADWLRRQPGLAAAWLFGSRARGESRPDSDVDVAVLLADGANRRSDRPSDSAAEPLRRQLRWTVGLADALGVSADRLDFIVLDDAPPLLAHAVVAEGRLLCDVDPVRRVAFLTDLPRRVVAARRLRDEAMAARASRLRSEP